MPYLQTEKRCKNCVYFVAEDDYSGECHHNPPQVVVIGTKAVSAFPLVRPDCFCGSGCWKSSSWEGRPIMPTSYHFEDNSDE